MKRSELTVGAELYYAEPSAWKNNNPADNSSYAGYRLGKATVLAVEPYHDAAGTYSAKTDYQPTRDGKGNGVLVELHAGSVRRRVVQLANLRGPWETTLAEVKERHARDLGIAERQRFERNQRTARIAAVVERAKAAGMPSAHRAQYDSLTIAVHAEELAALLDQIDEAYTRGVEAGREAGQLEAG